MAKDPIKKADNGTYYFRANLGYNPITGKQIQKYAVKAVNIIENNELTKGINKQNV